MLDGRTHGAPEDRGNDGKEETQKEKSVHLDRTEFVERILVGSDSCKCLMPIFVMAFLQSSELFCNIQRSPQLLFHVWWNLRGRRSGRVAEGTPLLRVQIKNNWSRGFESLLLRQRLQKLQFCV